MQITRLRGARTHNLKHVDVDLKPGELVVIAGPSGSGKSSLALDTLHAEGQRKYVESFNTYARQFLERLPRPPVDSLEPIPAALAVDRQAPIKSSRSTVGTMTELVDYLKDLWALLATRKCDHCGALIRHDSPETIAAQLYAKHHGKRAIITFPVDIADMESYLDTREALLAEGYTRVIVDGETLELSTLAPGRVVPYDTASVEHGKTKTRKRTSTKELKRIAEPLLEVIVDRLVLDEASLGRVREALERALIKARAQVCVHIESTKLRFSSQFACGSCGVAYAPALPALFSFNSAVGACEACRGFGRTIEVDWNKVIPDPSLSLRGGAIRAWNGKSTEWERRSLFKHGERMGIDLDAPISQLTPAQYEWLLEGEGKGWKQHWFGLKRWFKWLESRAYKMHVRVLLSRYRDYQVCKTCHGTRYKPDALAWTVDDRTIAQVLDMSVSELKHWLKKATSSHALRRALSNIAGQCLQRLEFLEQVGLGYLALSRASRTLSGGEAQRVALTTALSTSLNSALFIVDEPTAGLHPNDTQRLLSTLRELARRDNQVVVIEHDLEIIRGADRVIELGPEAGPRGGQIVFDGTPAKLLEANTHTGNALRRSRELKPNRGAGTKWLKLKGARGHNLKDIDLNIPLQRFTCITGVSGAGKSSLIVETLVPAVKKALGTRDDTLPFVSLEGLGDLKEVLLVDQAPLGRTSRGNPATYLKIWEVIRNRLAALPASKALTLKASAFSFNVAGGRCEACKGEGAETVEMQFLADVTFPCAVCKGRRFGETILGIAYRGKNAADLLEMSALDVYDHFMDDDEVRAMIRPLIDIGLGYLPLGQPLNTLSGGEAQRLKLSKLLLDTQQQALIVLDEPSLGLHAEDVRLIIDALQRRTDRGDTVIVIEHDMQMMLSADHIIDLGPAAGQEGGLIVAEGSPVELVENTHSITAQWLKRLTQSVDGTIMDTAPTRARASKAPKGRSAISVIGASEHNLKHVTVDIPREQLVVVTGPSGSGKSSLVFDIIHAEAQRRYLETLSPYARQYLPQLPRPNVDSVTGLAPSVALDQRTHRGGANSTVATMTEVAHYLRLLYAKIGVLHCPNDGTPIAAADPESLVETIRKRFNKQEDIALCAPLIISRKGSHKEVLANLYRGGAREAWIDGAHVELKAKMSLERFQEHSIDAVIARVAAGSDELESLLRRALEKGEGHVIVRGKKETAHLAIKRSCPLCGTGYPELDPRFFSFNTQYGACETCEGKGVIEQATTRKGEAIFTPCQACHGTRLSKLARSVRIQGITINEIFSCDLAHASDYLDAFKLSERERTLGKLLIDEAQKRLRLLQHLGLGYLQLDRAATTLSGGEAQRVRLAAQLGSGQTGLLYVLDEPTIGLHARDTVRLIDALKQLVARGCSVLVVEHDADTIRAADYVFDLGPSGGRRGGHIVAQGTPLSLEGNLDSPTGRSLIPAPIPTTPSKVSKLQTWLEVKGVTHHNLKNVDVRIPVGKMVAVSGVSGSGKSSLIRQVVFPALRRALERVGSEPGAHKSISGVSNFKRAVEVDQSPIGKTSRSVPATYLGIWDVIRKLLAATAEARVRGYTSSRFSFNASQGRCEACAGNGRLSLEMSFLPDVEVLCQVCSGQRFNQETLAIRWHGYSAGALLDLEVGQAVQVFAGVEKIRAPLQLLCDLGLDYLKLGQPSSTLSGGEAQRLKLVAELLNTARTETTLYVLDEPTTGLHREDIAKLLHMFRQLVERGHTVVTIEHHLDVMFASDWIIDLGPEGGAEGGMIVAEGTPEQLMKKFDSYTAQAMRAERKLAAA